MVQFPKISIITPSLNQAVFLERTILSVLDQHYPNLEYIIIDGGSTDGSIELIKKYEHAIAYWTSEKDKGQSDALNKGFAKATGDIVGWQNSDDVYLPGAFVKAATFFLKNPHIDILYGNRLDIDEHDQTIGELRYTKFSRLVYQYDGISVSNQSAFWKREVFNKIGLLDVNVRFAMDYEFFLRAACKKLRFSHVREYFGAARRYSTNRTNAFFSSPQFIQECASIDRTYGRRVRLNLPLKIYSLMYRFLGYILQGDLKYVVRGARRRIKNKSILNERAV